MEFNNENTNTFENETFIKEEDSGTVKISPDVISAIAYIATTEIDGIAGMAQNITGGIADLLGKKNAARVIKVDIKDSSAVIDTYITVQYGAVIQEVATKLQEKIKQNVESMTGMNVKCVNVYVQGVKFETAESAVAEETSSEQ